MRLVLYFLFLFHVPLLSQRTVEKALKVLELQRFEAMTKKDIPFLQFVLAEDLTYNHSNGLSETKTDHLDNIQSEVLVYKSIILAEEPKVRVYKRSAVINGLVKVTGILKGKAFDINLRYTDVYMKRKGKWQLVAWHSVKIE